MRKTKMPDGAEVVRTYLEYGQHIEAFFQRHSQLLIIVGRSGLSKSYQFEERIDGSSHLIHGWTAPLQAYIEAYHHRDKLLVFDDAETLWARPAGRILMRSLCEHRPRKKVQWTSTTASLAKAGVPQSFSTSSKVAIVCNRFSFGNVDERDAILDRGHVIHFDPPPIEVHIRVNSWFWDQDIYDHFGERLHLIEAISARMYIKAWERKKAGGDWRRMIDENFCHATTHRIVQELEENLTYPTVEDRVVKFVELTGCCRATYFNIKRELSDNEQLIRIRSSELPRGFVRGKPPADEDFSGDDGGGAGVTRQTGGFDPEQHGLPPWYDYSNNPDDYSDHSDFVADWWKRPKPEENAIDEEPARNFGGDNYSSLLREMQKAVDCEDYERAREFRDEIRRIEERNSRQKE